MSFENRPSGMPVVTVRPGDVIADKYEVEKVLAAGGMGVVLAAQHLQLKRRVALKFLLPELCEAPGIVARFLREAQAMTAIQNEHVARVLDVGKTTEGSPYMVMEYLEGEDLGQTLERRGRLPVHDAVDYVLQAMEALAEAHTNGFVHRDLKPSNLFMTQRPDGSPLVKVLDFGISKALTEKEQDANLTQTRGMLGSPLYMAPEQIRNSKNVDIRADIWTLGVILHELIAGKSPFENDTENVAAVLAAIMADDPARLDSIRQDVPKGLSEVVLRCLSRNRDDRYPTVGALASALTPFAPADSKVSIDRIRRVIDHHSRTGSAPNLAAVTIAKGLVTPRPEDDGWSPAAQLETTAAAPSSDPAIPISSPPRSGDGVRVRTPGRNSDTPTGDTTFGKYKLIALLGQGGMADVFLAVLGGPEGLGFSKLVVLKRLRANLANDKEFVAMLVDEARIAAKLNHPNVVQTHEVGVIDGEYYIAMEYLEGQPLSLVLQRAATGEPLSLAFKLGIVRDMLAGVHHAHQLVDFDGKELGLVHRDVTPQNVFVTYEGQVKVVDFGIAKARGRATETQQGILKGKVRYMSPEQAAGGDIDGRTDVFAAGVVLWELLVGQRMWNNVDDVAIIQKLMLDKIPSSPREVNPDIPKALDAIVRKALARRPDDRYDSAQHLQLDIERFMEAEGLKCAARDLGGYVATMFADRRKQARSLIEGQLSKLRGSEPPESLRVLKMRDSGSAGPNSQRPQRPSGTPPLERLDRDPIPESGRDSSRNAILARSDPGHSASGTGPLARQRSRLPFFGGLVAVVAAVVVVGMLARNKDNTRPPVTADTASAPPVVTSVVASAVVSAAPSATTTASATPTNEGPIQISLNAGAPRAEFSIDNGPKIKSPATLTRPRDNKSHQITATAPGYKPETMTVTFDKDVVWAVVLVGAHVKDGAKPPGVASSVATEAPSATTAASVATPAASGRKKREIDENPYSNQPQ